MRALIQRVLEAKVVVENQTISQIGKGLLTLLGISHTDTQENVCKMIDKISKLRVFEDDQQKMNLSLMDIRAEHLIVSQFTLYADLQKGNRPSFIQAAPPEQALELYQRALDYSQSLGIKTQGGQFRAHMKVHLINDGPVTLWINQD